jgi:hypothetical protein
MKSLIITIFMGAFLFTACGESAETPAPVVQKEAKKAPATKPPPPAKKSAPPPAAEEKEASGDCPAAMAEYEKFVDKYVVYIKKAAGGDLSAMTGMTSLMGQADKAGKELAAAQGDLTVDCLKKYNAINKKMTDAAMEMSKATPTQKVEVDAAQKAAEKALDAAGCMQKCQGITDPMKAATCMQGCM